MESSVNASTDTGGKSGPGDEALNKDVLATLISFISRKENKHSSTHQVNKHKLTQTKRKLAYMTHKIIKGPGDDKTTDKDKKRGKREIKPLTRTRKGEREREREREREGGRERE